MAQYDPGALRSMCGSMKLRFEESEEEAAFKLSLELPIARGGSIGCFIFLCGLALNIPPYLAACSRTDYPFQWDSSDPRTQYYSIRAGQLLVTCAGLVIFSLRWRSGCFAGLNIELMSVGFVALAIVTTSLSSSWHVPTQFGMDPEYIWGLDVRSSEFLVVLVIDVLMIAVCLFVPMRTCALWVLNVVAVVAFAAMVIFCGSAFPHSFPQCMLLHTSLCIFSFVGAHRNEQIAREKWKAQKQVDQQQEELCRREDAATHLLSNFCDCVVHIGPAPDFQVLEPSPRLAALLLHSDGNMLRGRNFRDFVAFEEEYDRLVLKMQGPSNVHGLGPMMNTHLKDHAGRTFAVSVSYASFRSGDVTDHFLLGINENQERPAIASGVSVNRIADSSHGIPTIIGQNFTQVAREQEFFLPSHASHNISNTDSNSSGGLFSAVTGAGVEEWVVTLDLASSSLTILSCSTAFRQMCGSNIVGRSFSDWLKHPKKQHGIFQDAVQELFREKDSVAINSAFKFSPFQGIEYQCDHCNLMFDEADEWIDLDDMVPVRVSMPRLGQRTRRPSKGPQVHKGSRANVPNTGQIGKANVIGKPAAIHEV